MNLEDLYAICALVKDTGKNEQILFMSEKVFNQEFDFLKSLHGTPTPFNDSEYMGMKCVAVVSYGGVSFYIIDPCKLGRPITDFEGQNSG